MLSPALTGSTASVFSSASPDVTLIVVFSSADGVAPWSSVADTLLLMVPADALDDVLTVMSIEIGVPAAVIANGPQVITPVVSSAHDVSVAPTNVVPDGIVSTILIPVASDGPGLSTVMV